MKFKKGDPTDILLIVIVLFVLAIGFVVYFFFTNVTADALRNSPLNISETQEGIQSLQDLGTYGSSNGFVMIWGAAILGVLISSFMVRVHPIFIIIYILTLTVSIALAAFLGNAYTFITANYPFNSINGHTMMENQPAIDFIMRNIVRITLAVGVISIIIVFAKVFGPSDSGGGV